jgi:hypothetical protein
MRKNATFAVKRKGYDFTSYRKVEIAAAVPKGLIQTERLVASLKRCADTKPKFFRRLLIRVNQALKCIA